MYIRPMFVYNIYHVACAYVMCLLKNLLTYLLTYLFIKSYHRVVSIDDQVD